MDHDLWQVLDLASDGELVQIYQILQGARHPGAATMRCTARPQGVCAAGASPFSPVLKSLLADDEPAAAALRGRRALMHRVETRFRFLAVSVVVCCGLSAWRTVAGSTPPSQPQLAGEETMSKCRQCPCGLSQTPTSNCCK